MSGDQPWHEPPFEVAAALRPALSDVADEIIEAVRTVPGYRRPLVGSFGEGIRAGVHSALQHFLAEIEAGGPVARGDVYRGLGRGEMRAGRSLDSLLGAYRIGARVAWRRFAAAGEAAGLPPSTLYQMAEALFAYIDVLSAESAEGHALEQSAAAGETGMWRRRLVRMLIREPPAEGDEVRSAAVAARWELPRSVAALVIGAELLAGAGAEPVAAGEGEREAGEEGEREAGALAVLRLRLPEGTLSDVVGGLLCVLVPDPDAPGRRAELTRLVAHLSAPAGLGGTVPWSDAAVSFTRATAALGLGGRPGELIVARERAGELLLAEAPALAQEFAADRLRPLDGETAASRERLTETLRAWLAEQGRLAAVARMLGVHPQTARYRIGRLRDLFGTALDDPDERFWLELALRVSAAARLG